MAYKIQYTPQDNSRYPMVTRRREIKWGRLVAVIVVAVATLWLINNGVPEILIPGDPQVTKAAAATMIGSMKSGSSMDDAILTFCRQIIDGAR